MAWRLDVFLVLAHALAVVAVISEAPVGSKGAPQDELHSHSNSDHKGVLEGSLLLQGDSTPSNSTPLGPDDLPDSAYDSADTGGSRWRKQLEIERKAKLKAKHDQKRAFQAQRELSEAIRVHQSKLERDARVRRIAHMTAVDRQKKMDVEDTEAATRVLKSEIAQLAPLLDKDKQKKAEADRYGGEWLQTVTGHKSDISRRKTGKQHRRKTAMEAVKEGTQSARSSLIRREVSHHAHAADLMRTQWFGSSEEHSAPKSDRVDEDTKIGLRRIDDEETGDDLKQDESDNRDELIGASSIDDDSSSDDNGASQRQVSPGRMVVEDGLGNTSPPPTKAVNSDELVEHDASHEQDDASDQLVEHDASHEQVEHDSYHQEDGEEARAGLPPPPPISAEATAEELGLPMPQNASGMPSVDGNSDAGQDDGNSDGKDNIDGGNGNQVATDDA